MLQNIQYQPCYALAFTYLSIWTRIKVHSQSPQFGCRRSKLLRPASFAIFQFLWVWNDYLIAFVFIGNERPVLTYTLLSLLGTYGQGWQQVAAGSFISLSIPLLVFFTLQRYFVRGLTAGAVK